MKAILIKDIYHLRSWLLGYITSVFPILRFQVLSRDLSHLHKWTIQSLFSKPLKWILSDWQTGWFITVITFVSKITHLCSVCEYIRFMGLLLKEHYYPSDCEMVLPEILSLLHYILHFKWLSLVGFFQNYFKKVKA